MASRARNPSHWAGNHEFLITRRVTASTKTLLLVADQRSWQNDTGMGHKKDKMPRTHIECGLLQGGALREREHEGRQQTVTPAPELQKALEELYCSPDHSFCPVVVRHLQLISSIDDSSSGLPRRNMVVCHDQATCLNETNSM